MDRITLRPIHKDTDSADALDLAQRASDYVILEVGRAPDADYIEDFFTAVPPGLDPEALMNFAIMQDTALIGITCIARGYEFPEDWWIGLLLLDPAYRGERLGSAVVTEIKTRAKRDNVAMLKLSVLTANHRGFTFWQREGFFFHRFAPATAGSDGHDRTVLKYVLHVPPGRTF